MQPLQTHFYGAAAQVVLVMTRRFGGSGSARVTCPPICAGVHKHRYLLAQICVAVCDEFMALLFALLGLIASRRFPQVESLLTTGAGIAAMLVILSAGLVAVLWARFLLDGTLMRSPNSQPRVVQDDPPAHAGNPPFSLEEQATEVCLILLWACLSWAPMCKT